MNETQRKSGFNIEPEKQCKEWSLCACGRGGPDSCMKEVVAAASKVSRETLAKAMPAP